MHPDQWRDFAKGRMAEERWRAERRRLVRSAIPRRPSLRGRAARLLFGMAFAVEAEETWRAVWESLAGGSRVPRNSPRKSRGLA